MVKLRLLEADEKKPTAESVGEDLAAKGLTPEEERVLFLRGKVVAKGAYPIRSADTRNGRVLEGGEIPTITTLRAIEERAMAAIAKMQKPGDSENK